MSLRRALTLAAASFAASAMAQTATAFGAITTLGCYSQSDPLTLFGDARFQSDGYCRDNCTGLEPPAPVMAIVGGSTCFCGDELPPLDTEVDSSRCNTICNGYGDATCGGINYWQVYLTGVSGNVHNAPNISSTSGSSSTSHTASSSSAAIVTKAGETVFVTNPASTDSPEKSSSGGGPSKVGIAVGVVVGVIALSGLIGVVVFILKRKRNREIEEEHRRTAATSFVQSDKASTNDQRLDPSISAFGRQSIGSIADERDFSRRILQVRNPDRDSRSSAMA